MAYNFLREARSIKNSFLCKYDTLDGYVSNFVTNGNVDGWTIYNGIYMYGCWNGVLFGTAYDRTCYIGKATTFLPIPAEDYYIVRILMKLTNNNTTKTVGGFATGRLQWTYVGNTNWDSDKQMDFDLIDDDAWHLYEINVGPKQYWQGDINNLRVYPFIDGWSGDQFAIKYIKITSIASYTCQNTQCEQYLSYSHPCPWTGARGSCEAGLGKSVYTTTSGIDDKLIINIDSYGEEKFDLGTNINLTPVEIAKVIANKIASINIGGYNYSEAEYSENEKLKIYSGNVGEGSTVSILDNACARTLGFFDEAGVNISTTTTGVESADGFDYASSRMLTSLEINKLVDGNTTTFAYIHEPDKCSVEGGRRDFNAIGTPALISSLTAGAASNYASFNNSGKTIIDISHPINNNGRINSIYVYGKITTLSKIKILRPYRDGTMKVLYSIDLPLQSASYIYTALPLNYRVDCDFLVSKGDLIGAYNIDLYVGTSAKGLPDAVFHQIVGDPSVGDIIDSGKIHSFGITGFAVYAKGDRLQSNVILDIDLGDRVNIEELNLYGKEAASYFEYNVAACLDTSWAINLYGGTHRHDGSSVIDGLGWVKYHDNVAYGLSCLDDCVTTADNGQVGTSYSVNSSNGLVTAGSNHSYFYVNGDAEWLWVYDCDGKHEYCYPNFCDETSQFIADPISFTIYFPYNYIAPIHKSIIYFKEKNNFRKLELAYYMGSYYEHGNATYDTTMVRIPNYTSIKLNGLEYSPEIDDEINVYLFKNPTNDEPIYTSPDGTSNPSNPDEVRAAMLADWTILEHNFEPINCRGFRFFTNKHYSTKILEMELYSKVPTTASLVDNVALSFSDYGDIWSAAPFYEKSEALINAFIGGAPRYMRLEFESSTAFNINEIECLVGDQVKLTDCSDSLVLNEAKGNSISNSTAVSLENVYGAPFDLMVDIPVEFSTSEDLVFWNKLNSAADVDDPQIGPGCRLYKSDDYYIGNDNFLCSTNAPAYALKNMAHAKNVYTNNYVADWGYTYYGTLQSGVSIDYTNLDRNSLRRSIISFPTPPNVYRYWKVGFDSINADIYVKDIIPYLDDTMIDIDTVYASGTVGTGAMTGAVSSTGLNLPTRTYYVSDTFSSLSGWSIYQNNTSGATMAAVGGAATVTSYGTAIAAGWYGPYMVKNFESVGDFRLDYTFYIEMYYASSMQRFDVVLTNSTTGYSMTFRMCDEVYGSIGTYFTFRVFNQSTNVYTSAHYGDGTYAVSIIRAGITLYVYVNEVLLYTSSSWPVTSFDRCTVGFYRQYPNGFYVGDDQMSLYDLTLSGSITDIDNNDAIGMRLVDVDGLINKVEMFHSNSAGFNTISLYGSNDNVTYNLLTSAGTVTTNNATWYQYFSVDLEKRHDLAIIRNYGTLTNKLDLGLSTNVDYSNSDTDDVYSVVWNNSTYNDVRWVRIKFLCGSYIEKYLRKLGIYPDISTAYCVGGSEGYNCDWESLGNILSEYTTPINIAYGATVTGTSSYTQNYYPTNAVDGINTNYEFGACWGISSTNNYIELDFGDTYSIDKVALYHGYDPGDTAFMNTAYNFSVSTSASGSSFTTVFSVTGNTTANRTHVFEPVYARRARLTITAYNANRLYFTDSEGARTSIKPAFLREIEVFTAVDEGYVDSETWPIVALNLLESFNITGHDVVNRLTQTTASGTDWSNLDEYFRYSDNIYEDPRKVVFNRAGSTVYAYYNTDATGDLAAIVTEYIFDEDIYLDVGGYSVSWKAYDPTTANEISLHLIGPETITLAADVLGSSTYVSQAATIYITTAGKYTIKVTQNDSIDNSWGARDIYIYRSAGLGRWISVTRDTATNYSFNGLLATSGIDYLSQLKVYGNEKYKIPEHYMWWQSTLSELANDGFMVMTGQKSLKISYPASAELDTLQIMEADDFGEDLYFSSKDLLHFYLYVDDITNLDTTYGDITFGSLNETPTFYYMWTLSGINLVSGWNDIKLKFEDANETYPYTDIELLYDQLNPLLNFRTNNRPIRSFRIRYKGIGNELTMYLDDLKIQRNRFEDNVKFGAGLCLTNTDYLEVPLSSLNLERGSLEFYIKLYTSTNGTDIFGDMFSRVLFTLINNNNDLVSLGIKSGFWFVPNSGNARSALNTFETTLNDIPDKYMYDRDTIVHIGVVWSNDGAYTDNGDTLRLYLDGEMVCASNVHWEVGDTKFATLRFGGPNTQLTYNGDISGSAIFSNIKVYNYCKTNFNVEDENTTNDIIYTPNKFLEISSDNINFYGVGSENLPITFLSVPNGESRTVYVRANKNKNFSGSNSTANLLISWLTAV